MLSSTAPEEVSALLPDHSDDPPHSPPPASLRADLQRAHAALLEAELAEHPSERYLAAHLAALRVAAIVLTVRGGRSPGRPAGRPRNAWLLVADVAPELAEWAAYFAATEAKRDAVRSGARALVTAREADDLIRDARAFLSLVERSITLGGPGTR